MDIQDYINAKLVHEIHTSERKSYRACRRRWDWIFRQNYYPKLTAKPLEFGVAYHQAMEVFYDPDTWFWPSDGRTLLATGAFIEKCEEQKKKFLTQSDVPYLEEEVEEDYNARIKLGKGMLEYYCGQLSPTIDKGWHPVKVEIPFMVPIPHPYTGKTMWCKCDNCWTKYYEWSQKLEPPPPSQGPHGPHGQHEHPLKVKDQESARAIWMGLPVVYAGRIDALMQDDRGGLWIVDWKTTARIADRLVFLQLDDQVGSYPWALRQLGIKAEGFIYHEQRKGFPQTPNRNKQRRLGCLFSVNKNQDVDYRTYLATIMAEDEEAYENGDYDDFLTYLQAEGIVYYVRHQIHKSQDELDEIGKNIGLEALELTNQDVLVYPSPGRFGCDSCAFQTPCIEKNGRGDYTYALETLFERREHYYVRTEPSTESKGGE